MINQHISHKMQAIICFHIWYLHSVFITLISLSFFFLFFFYVKKFLFFFFFFAIILMQSFFFFSFFFFFFRQPLVLPYQLSVISFLFFILLSISLFSSVILSTDSRMLWSNSLQRGKKPPPLKKWVTWV